MNRPDEDLFNRITELVSLLSNTDFEPTVNSISRQTNTSVEQTREDIRMLNQLGLSVAPQEIVTEFSPYDSSHDDEPLELCADIPGMYYSPYLLFLKPGERNLFLRKELKSLRVKDIPGSFSSDIQWKKDAITTAINRHCRIAFRYFSPRDGALDVNTSPHYLYHNTTDDLWYCVTIADGSALFSYRLDRIRSDIRLLPEKASLPDPACNAKLERLKYMWGASFDSSEEISHVRVRIEPDTANILSKIRSDIRDRKSGQTRLYKEDRYWILEDDIIGLSSFSAWLRAFGASVKVLEPASLAETIRRANTERLENYQAGRFVNN